MISPDRSSKLMSCRSCELPLPVADTATPNLLTDNKGLCVVLIARAFRLRRA